MKKLMALLVVMMFVAGLVMAVSGDEAYAKWGKKDKDEEQSEMEAGGSGEAKLIYTFKNQDEMSQFEQLYVAKQATFGRMGVLQAYFAMEQNNLNQIDAQMQESFGFTMDPNKIYDLNRDNMEIREVGPVPPPPAPVME